MSDVHVADIFPDGAARRFDVAIVINFTCTFLHSTTCSRPVSFWSFYFRSFFSGSAFLFRQIIKNLKVSFLIFPRRPWRKATTSRCSNWGNVRWRKGRSFQTTKRSKGTCRLARLQCVFGEDESVRKQNRHHGRVTQPKRGLFFVYGAHRILHRWDFSLLLSHHSRFSRKHVIIFTFTLNRSPPEFLAASKWLSAREH